MSYRLARARWLGLVPILLLLCALFGTQPAAAVETCTTISGGSCHPYWRVDSRSAPLNLPFAGEQLVAANDEAIKGKGQLTVLATNLGDAPANGATEPITVTDELPEGVELQEGTGVVEAITGGGVPEHVAVGVNEDLPLECKEPTRKKIECVFKETPTVKEPQIVPFNHLELRIPIKITRSSSEGPAEPLNKVTVSGGEAAEKKLEQKLKITGAAEEVGGKKVSTTKFGAERYELVPENEKGEVDTQAGSHPFQLTSVFDLNETYGFSKEAEKNLPEVPALQKNLDFQIPAGVLGNPDAVPQCPDLQFGSLSAAGANQCLDNTVIGVATVEFFEPNTLLLQTWSVPVFNLVPAPGEPAKFGFEITHVPVVLDTSVRTGSDYGVTVHVLEASGAVQVLGAAVTLWGTPGDPAHDSARGWNCLGSGRYRTQDVPPPPCGSHEFEHPLPFVLLPTSCKNPQNPLLSPLLSEVTGEAWSGQPLQARNEPPWAQTPPPPLTGCESLEFNPSIKVEPDTNQASTPAGMNVEVSLPQQETTMSPTHNGEADVRSTTLALPPGVQASAGAATGLDACGTGETGLLGNPLASSGFEQQFTPNPASCPEAAKIGTVEVNTPLLPHPLTGSLYLGTQNTNPFTPPLVLYLIASEEEPVKHEWSKVLIKLAGEVKICQAVEGPCQEVGQLVSTFRETPQAPFERLDIHLFGGGRASQATPARCGSYEAVAQFSPWPEGVAPATRSSKFAITSGPGGGPCPGPGALPFSPSFQGGATNTQAGAFTPFVITLGHRDGDQALTGLSMHLPEGAAAMLASVTPCPVAVADAGQCPQSSLIGHSMTSSGLGGSPVNLPGEAFLTESLRPGAPFGVSVLTNAEHVGPFNIGKIIANSTIQVDKETAAATITAVETRILESNGNTTVPSTPLPTMIKGVPVQLKQVIVSVDRPNFEFNPTTCSGHSVRGAATAISDTLAGAEGGSSSHTTPYAVTGCGSLNFTPKLTASATAQGSKLNGTTFSVVVEAARGQANIAKTFLQLPITLPSRLSTIQQACVAKVFEENPAKCDEGSNIGFAVAKTPVLKKPLSGPAYLVSHGNAAFPDVEFVLQSEGIEVLLDGKTDIKAGITYSRFETVPDAPVERFETVLPAGPHSALTANVPESEKFNLCKHASQMVMPTEITGQNGDVVRQTTKIALTGVCALKFKETALQRALKACKKKYAHNKSKRVSCERAAKKKYGPKPKAKKKK